MPLPEHFTPSKGSGRIVQEGGWAPGSVWTEAENLTHKLDSIPGPTTHNPNSVGR